MVYGHFLKYRRNIHSQTGEDGVIAELLKRLGISSGWCCEFGAWDGKHLSNTYALIEQGWRGVFIEGDRAKASELEKTAAEHGGRLIPICAFVEPAPGPTSLDSLLSGTPIPQEFDLLSIDVDSCDYQIWKGLTNYRPKIVVIEIDSKYEAGVEAIYTAEGMPRTTSFLSMLKLGQSKGYTLVCHTINMFFVRNDLMDKVGLPERDRLHPKRLFIYSQIAPSTPGQWMRKIWCKLITRY
jgi:hypothetical protein